MGRFIRVVAVKGSSKVSIIIPEISENVGWSDFADKIKRFVLEKEKARYEPLNSKSGESFIQVVQMEQWPKDEIKVMNDDSLEPNQLRIETSSLRSRVDYH